MSARPAVSLSDRIAAALNDNARTSAALAALLDEVQPEIARLKQRAEKVLEEALNPRRTAAEVTDLRAAAHEAEFEAARIERAATVLEEEVAALFDAESEVKRAARYDRAKAAAAVTAARISAEYPALANKLLALVGEVVEVTAEVVAVNRDLPSEREMIRGPEDIARGFALTAGTKPRVAPWLLAEMVLPPFAPSAAALWPRGDSGHGLARDSRLTMQILDPHAAGRWPDSRDVQAALAALAAQTGGGAVFASDDGESNGTA